MPMGGNVNRRTGGVTLTLNLDNAQTARDEAQSIRDHAEATKLRLELERKQIDRELHELATKDKLTVDDHKRRRALTTQHHEVKASGAEAARELQRKERALHHAESDLKVAEMAQEAGEGLIGSTRQEMDAFVANFAEELDGFVKDVLDDAREHDQKVNSLITRVNSQASSHHSLKTNGSTLFVETEEGTVSYSANAQFLVKKTIEETSRRFEAVQQQAAREQARQQEEAKRQAEEEAQKAHQEWLQSPEGQLEQARLASKYQWQDRKEPGMQVSGLKGVGAQ